MRETISRLTVHHARLVGWDPCLSAAMKGREDMQRERDSEMVDQASWLQSPNSFLSQDVERPLP